MSLDVKRIANTSVIRLRPRISLLAALLLMTVVGMAIVIVQLWLEVGPLRAENKRLNEERGTLVIGDPSQLHAIRIPARFAGEGRQSYRVYVPPGRTYFGQYPKYFAAFHSTDTGWTAEVAIPIQELTGDRPSHGKTWAANVSRVQWPLCRICRIDAPASSHARAAVSAATPRAASAPVSRMG